MEKIFRNKDIYEKYQSGTSISILAAKYGVTRQAIHLIVKRLSSVFKEKLRPRIMKKPMFIPKSVENDLLQGKISAKQAAELAKCHYYTILKLFKGRIPPYPYPSEAVIKARKRAEKVYNQFMEGKTTKELSILFNTSIGYIRQLIFVYRKRHNLPKKHRETGPGNSRKWK